VTWAERWSVVAVMVGVAGVVCLVAAGLGGVLGARSYWEAVAWGMVVLAGHGAVSLLAGFGAAGATGLAVKVGGHVGLYHLVGPWGVVARVGWLRKHRPGFFRTGFLRWFFGLYLGLAAAALALVVMAGGASGAGG
jgi:hypothetical protein